MPSDQNQTAETRFVRKVLIVGAAVAFAALLWWQLVTSLARHCAMSRSAHAWSICLGRISSTALWTLSTVGSRLAPPA